MNPRNLWAAACVATTLASSVAFAQPAQAVHFTSCADAAAHGFHDMRVGEPGYRPGLDRNRDGVACETDAGPSQPPVPKPTQPPIVRPTQPPVAPVQGRIYGIDASGNLQFFTGTVNGLKHVGTRGSGWTAMTYLAQVNNVVGDGNRDLVARRASDQSLWLYRTSSDGSVAAVRKIGSNWGGMDQIVPVFNLAGGSTQYVVARRASDGALFRYALTATGLTATRQIGTGWKGMRQIVGVGDFNKDGRGDVLGLHGNGNLYVYSGTKQGTIGEGRVAGHGWENFNHVFCPGDMSGDGVFDIIGRRSDGIAFAYANRGGYWGAAQQVLSGVGSYRLLA